MFAMYGISHCSYRRYPKPPYAYAGLITAAIWASPVGALTVSDIYASLRRMFAFFRREDYSGWQSSVRHTLTNTDCFVNKTTGSQRRWTVDAARVPPAAFRRQPTPEARRGQYATHLLTQLAAADETDDAAPRSGQIGVTSHVMHSRDFVQDDTRLPSHNRKLSFGVESFLPSRGNTMCPNVGGCVETTCPRSIDSYRTMTASPDVHLPPLAASRVVHSVESFLPPSVTSSTEVKPRFPMNAPITDVKPHFPMCATAAPPIVATFLPSHVTPTPPGFGSLLSDLPVTPSHRPSHTTALLPGVEMSRSSHAIARPFDIESLLSSRGAAPPSVAPRPSRFLPVAPPCADMRCLSSDMYPYYVPSIPQCSGPCNSLSFLADLVLATEGYF